MEPLNLSSSDSADEKKSVKNPDRIALSEAEARKVEQWLEQVREASKGYLSISKSDVVNFLIREHRDELLGSEIKRLRGDHYNPVRHIQWIMPQIKAALARGDTQRVADLQAELRGIELSVLKGTQSGEEPSQVEPKIRKKRAKKSDQNTEVIESKNSEISAEKS